MRFATCREAVDQLLRAVPLDDVMAHVTEVTAHDRYQASRGIEAAAGYVAEMAEAAGLADVSIERHPADGAARWWTFDAPVSWTPAAARLEVWTGGRHVLTADHARQPFTIATHSAATPSGGLTAPLKRAERGSSGLNGAVAVLERDALEQGDAVRELSAAGAVGFVTGAAAPGERDEGGHPVRVELDPRAELFGFSLAPDDFGLAHAAADAGGVAQAVVEIDRTATMPVVTGVLPGELDEEIWLTAHLCHPRPSANDNASGVAAQLGVAATLAAARRRDASWATPRAIRFVWGPEFVGAAAALHRRLVRPGGGRPPAAAINLDMVGEDQRRCGGPFVLERPPDCAASLLAPLAEQVLAAVFAATSRSPGAWRPARFAGFSDHALFADPRLGSPAVQLCHAPDRFNHTAADSLDKVSPVETRRATAAAAALAQIAAGDVALSPAETKRTVEDWCAAERTAVAAAAREHRAVDGGAWARQLLDYGRRRTAELRSLVDGDVAHLGAPGAPKQWPGPFNPRALVAALPPRSRAAVTRLIRSDRDNGSLLIDLAIRGGGTREQTIREASFARRRPVDAEVGDVLYDGLVESGWYS